ncbi:fibropellin-1-like [Asterias rubens]|uniref:fibropellin-1-like n=1 Tax=Asterias rubens TaxID=7604 RepID=UPI00145571F5|nr:fibropellin-1-like [Asterias rubens]
MKSDRNNRLKLVICLILWKAFPVLTQFSRGCGSCFCVDSVPEESCVNGYCYEFRGTPYCRCYDGYKGNRCQFMVESFQFRDPCNPNPCMNFGYCQEYQDSYLCTCVTGFTGINCQDVTTASPCDGVYCSNGKTCVALQLGYICV